MHEVRLVQLLQIGRNLLKRRKDVSATPLAHGVDTTHGSYGIRCCPSEFKSTISGNVIVGKPEWSGGGEDERARLKAAVLVLIPVERDAFSAKRFFLEFHWGFLGFGGRP